MEVESENIILNLDTYAFKYTYEMSLLIRVYKHFNTTHLHLHQFDWEQILYSISQKFEQQLLW